MIRPYTVALIYNDEKAGCYAKAMESLIIKAEKRYPIIPFLINEFGNEVLSDSVQGKFESTDYVVAFFSDAKAISPGVMLTIGYFIKKFGRLWKDKIDLIADCDENNMNDIFPSDIPHECISQLADVHSGKSVEETEEYKKALSGKFDEIISHAKGKDFLFDIEDTYQPKLERIFKKEEKEDNLYDLSLAKQYKLLLDHWQSEKLKLEEMSNPASRDKYLLLYLFERVLFLLAFKDVKLLNATEDMFTLDLNNKSGRILELKHACNGIIKYIFGHSTEQNAQFYNDLITPLQNAINNKNSNDDEFPYKFPYTIIENYLGLCYRQLAMRKKGDGDVSYANDFFRKAQGCHQNVVGRLDSDITITNSIITAYATFNVARSIADYCAEDVLTRSINRKIAKGSLGIAVAERKRLADDSETPDFVRRHFQLEYLYAKYVLLNIDIEEKKESQEYDWHEINSKLNDINATLEEIEELAATIVGGNPLLHNVKKRYEEKHNELEDDLNNQMYT